VVSAIFLSVTPLGFDAQLSDGDDRVPLGSRHVVHPEDIGFFGSGSDWSSRNGGVKDLLVFLQIDSQTCSIVGWSEESGDSGPSISTVAVSFRSTALLYLGRFQEMILEDLV